MEKDHKNRLRRLLAGIFVSLLVFILLFSSFYVAVESDHDCPGDDCEICECIRLCEDTLHRVFDFKTASLAQHFTAFILIISAVFIISEITHDTPVTSKVRLNN